MQEIFNNKYRVPSARLQSWNYAYEGMYFITICTQNREHHFGNIQDSVLVPTEIGRIAWKEWFKAIEVRPDMNIELGEFVVMPNHIHGIIIIGRNEFNRPEYGNYNEYQNQFISQSKNLASIIRGYKSAVSSYAKKNNIAFGWQTRFHEHIIRSDENYQIIANYIINNPAKWQEDKFFDKKL
jgi:REP element-mobilizing transposase RayT